MPKCTTPERVWNRPAVPRWRPTWRRSAAGRPILACRLRVNWPGTCRQSRLVDERDRRAMRRSPAQIDNLQVALPPHRAGGAPTVWQEPQVNLAVDLDYDQASDAVANQSRTIDRGRDRSAAWRQDRRRCRRRPTSTCRGRSWPTGHGWSRCGALCRPGSADRGTRAVALFAARSLDARRHAGLGRAAADGRAGDGELAAGEHARHRREPRIGQRGAERWNADARAGRRGSERRQSAVVAFDPPGGAAGR